MNCKKDKLTEATMLALQGELTRKNWMDMLNSKDKKILLLEILNSNNKQEIADLLLNNLDNETISKIINLSI